MALYLCSRKRTAKERHLQYKEYFLNLCKKFGQHLIDIWTTAIERVEEERIDNVAAMDIYIPQAVTRVARASTDFATGPTNLSTGLSDKVPGTVVRAWLEFALVMEEMQLVNFLFFVSGLKHFISESTLLVGFGVWDGTKIQWSGTKWRKCGIHCVSL